MPITPKVRPVGQPVVLATEQEFESVIYPIGTKTVVEDCRVGSDYKVSYKIRVVNRIGNQTYYWVKAADIKTP